MVPSASAAEHRKCMGSISIHPSVIYPVWNRCPSVALALHGGVVGRPARMAVYAESNTSTGDLPICAVVRVGRVTYRLPGSTTLFDTASADRRMAGGPTALLEETDSSDAIWPPNSWMMTIIQGIGNCTVTGRLAALSVTVAM
jgi:hypothetical protein